MFPFGRPLYLCALFSAPSGAARPEAVHQPHGGDIFHPPGKNAAATRLICLNAVLDGLTPVPTKIPPPCGSPPSVAAPLCPLCLCVIFFRKRSLRSLRLCVTFPSATPRFSPRGSADPSVPSVPLCEISMCIKCAASVHWLCNGCAADVQRVCIGNRAYKGLWARFLGQTGIGCATVVRLMCGSCAAAVFSLHLPLIYNKKKIKEIDPPTLSDERDSPAAARGRKFFRF